MACLEPSKQGNLKNKDKDIKFRDSWREREEGRAQEREQQKALSSEDMARRSNFVTCCSSLVLIIE